jgi:septation ring formation regulator EzrA
MKNKNETNYTVKQLTDKLVELQTIKFPKDPSAKWAYVAYVLEAMLDWEVKGYSGNVDSIQDRINSAYLRYENEIQAEKDLKRDMEKLAAA